MRGLIRPRWGETPCAGDAANLERYDHGVVVRLDMHVALVLSGLFRREGHVDHCLGLPRRHFPEAVGPMIPYRLGHIQVEEFLGRVDLLDLQGGLVRVVHLNRRRVGGARR